MLRYVVVILVVCLYALPAFANPKELMKLTPGSSKLLMGANVEALKPSPLYADMLSVIRSRPAFAEFLKFLEEEAGLNVDRDIKTVVVAMPEVSVTPAQAGQQDTMTFAVRGKFDQKKLLAAIDAKFPNHPVVVEDTLTRHTLGDVALAFTNANDIVMTVGDMNFQAETWAAFKDAKVSAASNTQIAGMAGKINLTRGMWLIGLTSQLPQNGPQMNVAGMTVDIASGLKVDIVGTMNSKADVEQSLKDFETLKKEATNPMVTMMGAAPLVANLKTGSKGLDVTMSTSMTAPQLQNMMGLLKATVAAGTQPVAPPKGKEVDLTEKPSTPTKGADADFN